VIDVSDWATVVEEAGHYVLVATHRGSVGCVYCGTIAHSGASYVAVPSVNLTTLGRGYGTPKTFSTRELALEWLVSEARARANKFVHGTSGVGDAVVKHLMKPLID
jgi:hypothetical protein